MPGMRRYNTTRQNRKLRNLTGRNLFGSGLKNNKTQGEDDNVAKLLNIV